MMSTDKTRLVKIMADVRDTNGNTMMYESDAERVLEAIEAAGYDIVPAPDLYPMGGTVEEPHYWSEGEWSDGN